MTRPLRVGDRVTATGTVNLVGVFTHVDLDGADGSICSDHSAWTLIAPAEPPVGSVVVKDGNAYTRFPSHGRRCWGAFGIAFGIDNEGAKTWDDISDGDVIFTPGGDA